MTSCYLVGFQIYSQKDEAVSDSQAPLPTVASHRKGNFHPTQLTPEGWRLLCMHSWSRATPDGALRGHSCKSSALAFLAVLRNLLSKSTVEQSGEQVICQNGQASYCILGREQRGGGYPSCPLPQLWGASFCLPQKGVSLRGHLISHQHFPPTHTLSLHCWKKEGLRPALVKLPEKKIS